MQDDASRVDDRPQLRPDGIAQMRGDTLGDGGEVALAVCRPGSANALAQIRQCRAHRFDRLVMPVLRPQLDDRCGVEHLRDRGQIAKRIVAHVSIGRPWR